MDDFAELVDREARGLVAAVTAILGDAHRAEEITQDAFERCYRRWRRISRLDRPGAWVRRVAINAAISSARRSAGERRAVARLAASAPTPVAADLDCRLDDEAIWESVRRLPTDQAKALALRYGADLSIADIASTMELSDSAVKSLLHRGRAALRSSPDLAVVAG